MEIGLSDGVCYSGVDLEFPRTLALDDGRLGWEIAGKYGVGDSDQGGGD